MEAKDVMGIVALIRGELGYNDVSSDVYDRVIRIHEAENYEVFVAEEDNRIIGFVGLMRGLAFELDGEYIRVIALAVSREYQSRGVGSRLEERVEQYAKETGANSIVLSSGLTRTRAHVFYTEKGYEKKGFSFIKLLSTGRKFSYNDVVYKPIPSRLNRPDSIDDDEYESDDDREYDDSDEYDSGK